jgi:O-antigen ligase
VLRSPSFTWFNPGDRRVGFVLCVVLLGTLCTTLAYAIGTGKYVIAGALLVLALIPLLLVVALKRPYVFPYALFILLVPFENIVFINGVGTLSKLLAAVSALFIIIHAARSGRLSSPPLAVVLWLIYLAWASLSLLWTLNAANAPAAAIQTATIVLFYALLAVAPIEARDLSVICGAILVGGILVTVYGAYLVHSSPSVVVEGRAFIGVGSRKIDPNEFGNQLLAPLALALAGLLNARGRAVVWASLATAAILVSGMLLTISREALIGAVIVLIVSVWFSRHRLLGFAIGVPAIVAIPLLFPSILERMAEAPVTGGAGRISVWAVGVQAFAHQPWLGWGIGSAIEAYNRTYLAVYQSDVVGWNRPPHDTLLRAGMELGVIGLVLCAAAYTAVYFQLRGIVPGDRLYPLKIALLATLCGFTFVSFLIDVGSAKYVWVVIAAVAQLRTVAQVRTVR